MTFDPLTLKVVSKSRVTWATSVPILVFLGLSVLDLGLMYTRDVRQTDVRQYHHFMPPPISGGHNNLQKQHTVVTCLTDSGVMRFPSRSVAPSAIMMMFRR